MSAPDINTVAQKADITTGYMDTYGGRLVEAQAREFITRIQGEPTLLGDVNVVVMEAPKQRIEVSGINGRAAFPDVIGTATTAGQRTQLTMNKQLLDAQDFRAAVFVDYKVMSDNIMGQGLAQYVQTELARQCALDIEDNVINGDTESVDASLAPFDGLVKQATTHVIDSSSSPVDVDDDVFYTMRQTLPAQFWRDLPNMRFYCSPRVEAAYMLYCKNNPMAIGNKYQSPDMGNQMEFTGAPLRRVFKMPDDVIILTHRMNIQVGFWKQMFLESFRDIDAGVDKFLLRFACDTKYVDTNGVVIFKGLKLGLLGS